MNASHSLSAMSGFVVAGILALTTSQAAPPPATLNPAALRVEYMPHPRDMVQITEGTFYTVPPDKVFVLTAVGVVNGGSATATFYVDGIPECSSPALAPSSNPVAVPIGRSVSAGRVIHIDAPGSTGGRAWGYLANQ